MNPLFIALFLLSLIHPLIAHSNHAPHEYHHDDEKIEAEINARIALNTPSIPSEWHDQLDEYQAIYEQGHLATGMHHSHSNVGPGGIPAMYAYGGPMPHEHHRSHYHDFEMDENGEKPVNDRVSDSRSDHHVPYHAHHSHPNSHEHNDDHHVPTWMDREEQRKDVKYSHLGSNTAADKLRAKKIREDKERGAL